MKPDPAPLRLARELLAIGNEQEPTTDRAIPAALSTGARQAPQVVALTTDALR